MRPELAFILRCVSGAGGSIGAPDGDALDWSLVLQLARRHGLLPLVFRQLAAIPEPERARFDRACRPELARTAALTGEAARLLAALEQAGLPALAYKGPALAAQAHGAPSARSFVDLDLLVRRADLPAVRRLMAGLGYRPLHPRPIPDWILFGSECDESFTHDGRAVVVEAHWAVAPPWFSFSLPTEALLEGATTIEVPGFRARVPGDEDTVLLLCLNGTKDGWRRLESVCTLAAFVRARPELRWDRVLARAHQVHGLRLLHVGLLLARRLCDLPLPPAVAPEAEADHAAHRLTALIGRELTATTAGPAGGWWRTLAARERWRDRGRACVLRALRPTREDAGYVTLPQTLGPLYFMVRPWRLAGRLVRRNT